MASDNKEVKEVVVTKVRMLKAGQEETKVRKAEQNIIAFNAKETEDQFIQFQGIDGILHPPIQPRFLKLITTHNNTLNQAVAAMEINIDGSGFVIEVEDDKTKDEKGIKDVTDFFKQVAPGVSFLNLRRKLRRDKEAIGYGFIEVVRNMAGEVVMMKHVDALTVRLIRLGAPIRVTKTLIRGGQELDIEMWVRERRFVQIIANNKVFFKEYGAVTDINKKDGMWAEDGKTFDFNIQGSELMYFTIDEDAQGPYGVPRWINNMPSALGSRKAEEQNLDFFDNGGVPPVIMTIMGGRMVGDIKTQLENFLTGRNKNTRIAVLEAQSADGNIDGNAGKLKIDVQRFGSEKINDSLFENYDERCSERIRSSFRLPPLFLGLVRDFNFATAKTAYMIAESQVFGPERVEFDNIMTAFIQKELSAEDLKFRSLPITLTDSELQIKGLGFATKEKLLNGEQTTNVINEITNLGLTFDAEVREAAEAIEAETRQDTRDRFAAGNNSNNQPPNNKNKNKPTETKSYTVYKDEKEVADLFALVTDLADIVIGAGEKDYTDTLKEEIKTKYYELDKRDQEFVQDLISLRVYDSTDLDKEGARELIHGCIETE